jgi:hypothetical protein
MQADLNGKAGKLSNAHLKPTGISYRHDALRTVTERHR